MHRRFFSQLVCAMGLMSAIPRTPASGKTTTVRRVDVHCHYLPDFYREALIAAGLSRPDGIPRIPDWSEESALAAMDEMNVSRAYISISSPGVNFSDPTSNRSLARRVNEEGARLTAAHPQRFGYFASTPLPDIEGAVAEATYAMDHLGASGVVFSTNFNGLYLGDEKLAPLYAELDRRNAIVFVHPTGPASSCSCCGHVETSLPYPKPMMEFLFDTTRTITDMVLSGTLARYPNIKVIVPHAGAALPLLASRIDFMGRRFSQTDDPMHQALKKLHFDLAGMPLPDMLPALLRVANPQNIHFGSDWPFTPLPECKQNAAALDSSGLLEKGLLTQVMHDNAELLFSRV